MEAYFRVELRNGHQVLAIRVLRVVRLLAALCPNDDTFEELQYHYDE